MGALLGLADSVAGLCGGLAALPGWVVSTNLMLRAVDLRRGRAARAARRRAAGRAQRGRDERRASATRAPPTGSSPTARSPRRSSCPRAARRSTSGRSGLAAPALDPDDDSRSSPTYLGTRPVGADTLAIDVTEQVRNPWGILHGGVTAALVDLAARHATGGRATTDTVLHFLAPGSGRAR